MTRLLPSSVDKLNNAKIRLNNSQKGGRPELAESEKAEMAILETYLPQMMSREDVMKVAVAKKAELGVTDKSGAGKFMGALMKEFKGQTDGDTVKSVVDELLTN